MKIEYIKYFFIIYSIILIGMYYNALINIGMSINVISEYIEIIIPFIIVVGGFLLLVLMFVMVILFQLLGFLVNKFFKNSILDKFFKIQNKYFFYIGMYIGMFVGILFPSVYSIMIDDEKDNINYVFSYYVHKTITGFPKIIENEKQQYILYGIDGKVGYVNNINTTKLPKIECDQQSKLYNNILEYFFLDRVINKSTSENEFILIKNFEQYKIKKFSIKNLNLCEK